MTCYISFRCNHSLIAPITCSSIYYILMQSCYFVRETRPTCSYSMFCCCNVLLPTVYYVALGDVRQRDGPKPSPLIYYVCRFPVWSGTFIECSLHKYSICHIEITAGLYASFGTLFFRSYLNQTGSTVQQSGVSSLVNESSHVFAEWFEHCALPTSVCELRLKVSLCVKQVEMDKLTFTKERTGV